MHPAKSVIFFTTASGAGYGLLVWLAVYAHFGVAPASRSFGFAAFGLAFTLIVAGLLSSTFHLGRPERAWRAMSQWRSSWLSREGLAAVITFVPAGLFALSWCVFGQATGWAGVAGWLGAGMSLVTVFATAMIYASLKAIPAWRNMWTAPVYLVLSLMTGALLAALLHAAWAFPRAGVTLVTALALVGLGAAVKSAYWLSRHNASPVSTAASATGLGRFGEVKLIEAPHTEANYLLNEMGFQIARKHAASLRRIAFASAFIAPTIGLGASLIFPGTPRLIWLVPATASCAVGVVIERWLFFAEARHVVTLYYGQERA